jgi:alpha-L-fucosidase
VSKFVKPSKDYAHIETFFTVKGKDLYCLIPAYRSSVKLRNFKPAPGTSASILGSKKALPFKQSGTDCVIDLSRLLPDDISGGVLAIKLRNAL